MARFGFGFGFWCRRRRRGGGAAPAPAPMFLANPIVPIEGTVGQPLTATPGIVSDGAIIGRQWFADLTAIPGATAASYAPTAADTGVRLRVREAATGPGGGPVYAWSNWTNPVSAQEDEYMSVWSIAARGPVTEGNSGTTMMVFDVSRSGGLAHEGKVDFAVTGGSADGADLSGSTSGTVTLAQNVTSGTIMIAIAGDTTVEPDETVVVSLSNPRVSGSIAAASATGVIVNDDSAALASYAISGAPSSIEGNSGTTYFNFTVTRSAATNFASTIAWAVAGSGANPANAADFGGAMPSGTLTFAAGETSKTISVAVAGDTVVELDEAFSVTISSPNPAGTITAATATGSILNDDSNGGGEATIYTAPSVEPDLSSLSRTAWNTTASPDVLLATNPDHDVSGAMRIRVTAAFDPAGVASVDTLVPLSSNFSALRAAFNAALNNVPATGSHYIWCRYESGANVGAWSTPILHGNNTAPAITAPSANGETIIETLPLALGVTWSGVPGYLVLRGQDQLSVTGVDNRVGYSATVGWLGDFPRYFNGWAEFVPGSLTIYTADQNRDNIYDVEIVVVGINGVEATKSYPITLQQMDRTPDAFAGEFTNVTNATRSTAYTDTFTVSGMHALARIAVTASTNGIRRAGASTWVNSISDVKNGDVIEVQLISSPDYSTATLISINANGVTAVWQATTLANPAGSALAMSATGTVDVTSPRNGTRSLQMHFEPGLAIVILQSYGAQLYASAATLSGAAMTLVKSGRYASIWTMPVAAAGLKDLAFTGGYCESTRVTGFTAQSLAGASDTDELPVAYGRNPIASELTFNANGLGLAVVYVPGTVSSLTNCSLLGSDTARPEIGIYRVATSGAFSIAQSAGASDLSFLVSAAWDHV